MKHANAPASVEKEFALESIISSAVRLPGVKVERKKFLAEVFASEDYSIEDILARGPVAVGVPQDKLASAAQKLILKRTSQSSAASFVAGVPGGLAMAATIPADVLQFFGMALRLAQELSYLYGAQDLSQGGQLDDEAVKNRLLLYCGVMFGASGAVSGVRVLSTQIAKTTLKKLPQKALTKTFWYPVVKQVGKAVGVKVTKSTVSKGISKAIPVIGGVVSGGLNFASMLPMANRLQAALDSAAFGYTEAALEKDIQVIEQITLNESDAVTAKSAASGGISGITESGKKVLNTFSDFFGRKKSSTAPQTDDDVFDVLRKLSELKEEGILTQEEFDRKKAELLSGL